MDELERQLRDLAAHRASQVPEFDASSLTSAADDGHGPNWGVLLAVAALIVALMVGGGYLLFGRTDDDNVRVVAAPSSSAAPASTVAPTTTPPTTTGAPASVANCSHDGMGTSEQSGVGSVSGSPNELVWVQTWSSSCLDEVAISYLEGSPNWSIGYQQPPFELLPSGQPTTVAGSAFLVLRLQPAGGTFSSTEARGDVVVPPPSGVREIRRVQDFEGVSTWVIGLDEQQPFRVFTRAGEVVVDIATGATRRTMSCANEAAHYRLTVPDEWFVLSSTRHDPCAWFAAQPRVLILGDPPPPGPVVALDPVRFADHQPLLHLDVVSTRDTTLNGRPARLVEGTISANDLYAGTRYYEWAVDWGAEGTLTIAVYDSFPTSYETDKAGADEIANSARFVP
jgi:hypothetical protein